jgi:hypothetical protein
MQVQRFSNGGFVLHKCFGQRISAWYSNIGILIDCERIDSLGRSRRPSKTIFERLCYMGPNWV